jgi:acetylglutamate synthase
LVLMQTALKAHGLWTSHGCWQTPPTPASVNGQASLLEHLTTSEQQQPELCVHKRKKADRTGMYKKQHFSTSSAVQTVNTSILSSYIRAVNIYRYFHTLLFTVLQMTKDF